MTGTRIILIDDHDRHRHVLSLAHASATAELVADWAEQRDDTATAPRPLTIPRRASIHLPSLQDFLGSRTTAHP
ncbi:MAG: hypothetical protein AAFZ07_15130 [Actinomycetota bacterium]